MSLRSCGDVTLNTQLLSLTVHQSLSCPAARSVAAASLIDDTSSQHSSDLSDTRTEHSDEDVGDKGHKRSTSVKATKKPAAAKTEVGHTRFVDLSITGQFS